MLSDSFDPHGRNDGTASRIDSSYFKGALVRCDISGFQEIYETMQDPMAVDQFTMRYWAAMNEVAEALGGEFVREEGDGILYGFREGAYDADIPYKLIDAYHGFCDELYPDEDFPRGFLKVAMTTDTFMHAQVGSAENKFLSSRAYIDLYNVLLDAPRNADVIFFTPSAAADMSLDADGMVAEICGYE